MLNWNDVALARVRQEELLREAELERLVRQTSRRRSLAPKLTARIAPRALVAAVAVGALAFVLR